MVVEQVKIEKYLSRYFSTPAQPFRHYSGPSVRYPARTVRLQRFYQTIDIHLFILHPCKASTSGAYNWSYSASKIRTGRILFVETGESHREKKRHQTRPKVTCSTTHLRTLVTCEPKNHQKSEKLHLDILTTA